MGSVWAKRGEIGGNYIKNARKKYGGKCEEMRLCENMLGNAEKCGPQDPPPPPQKKISGSPRVELDKGEGCAKGRGGVSHNPVVGPGAHGWNK